MLIIKNNGDYQEFDYKKARKSVMNALESSIAPTTAVKMIYTVDRAIDKAIRKVVTKKRDHRFITTEEIRTEIEKQLITVDYRLAKAYIVYPYIKRGEDSGHKT